MVNPNSRDGRRKVTATLAQRLGYQLNVRQMRKLQMELAIRAMLNRWKVQQCKNGEVRFRP